MKKIKSLFAVLLSMLILTPSIALATDEPVLIRSSRVLGMGGAGVGLADDDSAFFYNPAGITQRQGSMFTLLELPVSISNDTIDFYNYYNANQNELKNFNQQPIATQERIINDIVNTVTKYRTEVTLGFPNVSYLSSGQQAIAWGFGVFDQADAQFQFQRGLIIPNLYYAGSADAEAALPLAHKFETVPYIPGQLSVGVNLKYIARAAFENTISVVDLDNININPQIGKGFGADIGTLYQPNTRWNFGLQVTDVGGTKISYDALNSSSANQPSLPGYTSLIDTQWNFGTAYIPSRIYYWPGKYINSKDRIIFVADVRDFMNTDSRLISDYFWTKLHLGLEFRWGPLSLRGGFNQGYPTIGVGARIPYLGLRLEYAYWSDELGEYAGQIPESRHQLTIALSWGDAKGRAYGKDVKSSPVMAKKETEPKTLTPSTTTQATVPVQPQMSAPALPAGTQVAPVAPAAPATAAIAPAAAQTTNPASAAGSSKKVKNVQPQPAQTAQ